MKNFCTANYSELSGEFKCDCGHSHDFYTRCVLEKGAFARLEGFISDFTPPMSRIAVFGDGLSVRLKRTFRVVQAPPLSGKKAVEEFSLPEDVKLIVAKGDCIDSAKYKAYMCDVPLIVADVPMPGTLSPMCVLKDGRYSTFVANRPAGFIFDLSEDVPPNRLASLYGGVAARINTAFERFASHLFTGGEYCGFCLGAMSDIASKAVVDLARDFNKEALLQAALKLELLRQTMPPVLVGEEQCALVYDMLDPGRSRGELEFVFAAVLTMLYKNHVLSRPSFTAPPDNLMRLKYISSLFDISEQRAIRYIKPQISGKEAALIDYKIREYAPDLNLKLSAGVSMYKLAFKTFKRLYDDDGYSLKELGADISLAIALAPDVVSGGGMLTVLKRLGELDKYIV